MIYHCSCAELSDIVPASSVDAIITDPPYGLAALESYGDLARFAAYALKPGGVLAALVGHYHLPEILEFLKVDGLEYRWLGCFFHNGNEQKNFSRKVTIGYKPILFYHRSGSPPAGYLRDVYISRRKPLESKRHHAWGQNESTIVDLVREVARPGSLIVDPFVGGGTTAIAALALGCEFIGADIDADAVATTRRRMLEYQPVMPGM